MIKQPGKETTPFVIYSLSLTTTKKTIINLNLYFVLFCSEMHQTFQKDLFKFRIKTAKEFLRSLTNSTTPISTNPNEPLKINAQVQGIGPMFKLILKVQNISSTSPSVSLYITFVYDEKLYKISKNFIEVLLLLSLLLINFSINKKIYSQFYN